MITSDFQFSDYEFKSVPDKMLSMKAQQLLKTMKKGSCIVMTQEYDGMERLIMEELNKIDTYTLPDAMNDDNIKIVIVQ